MLWCTLHDEHAVWAQQGCFSYNYVFWPRMASNLTVGDARECQLKCRESAGCEHFTYWKKDGMCLLASGDASLRRTAVEGSIAGPAACMPMDPVCSQKAPGPDFFAPTASRSRRAWIGNQQPTNLQCWPRREDGFPERCPYQQVKILEDTMEGWPGRCENMRKVTDLRPGETCKMRCYNSVLCGVWSEENRSGVPTCWQALHGTNCYRSTGYPPLRAQRIMHGGFRKLVETMGIRINNLTKAFDMTDVGNNKKEGSKRCRIVCLSYLFCQYWQYSSKTGCWVEDPAAREVAYPMVNSSWAMENDGSIFAGEYIQHVCERGRVVPFPTDPPGSGFPAYAAPVRSADPVVHPGRHNSNAASSATGSRDMQPTVGQRANGGASGGIPLWLKALLTVLGIALCLACVAGGVYMAMKGHQKGARGMSGGSKKAGSSKRSQRTEQSFQAPSLGQMNNYGEPTAWQQGETVPFMHNQGGQPQQQRGDRKSVV